MNTKAIRSVATLLRGIHGPYDQRQPFGFDGGNCAGHCAAFTAAMLNPSGYMNALVSEDEMCLQDIARTELGITSEQAAELFQNNPRICVHAYEYVKVEHEDITKEDLADVLERLAGAGVVDWSCCDAGQMALAREGLADDPFAE